MNSISTYSPLGESFQWEPSILFVLIAGEALHFVSYTLISTGIIVLLKQPWGYCVDRLKPLLVVSAAFIFCGAITHLINIISIFYPIYRIQTWWLVWSACIALGTAIMAFVDRYDIGSAFIAVKHSHDAYSKTIRNYTAASLVFIVSTLTTIFLFV